ELLEATEALEDTLIHVEDDDAVLNLAKVVAALGARIRAQALEKRLVERTSSRYLAIGDYLRKANWTLTPELVRLVPAPYTRQQLREAVQLARSWGAD